MSKTDDTLDPYEVIGRLLETIDTFPDDQKLVLLRHLVKGNVTRFLRGVVIDMAVEEQSRLLSRLKRIRRELRRKHERRPCMIPVDYASQDRIFKDYIQDVSASGVFIESREDISIGEDVILAFSLPHSDEPLKIAGRVVRKDENGYGVKFENLTPYREDLIDSLLTKIEDGDLESDPD